MSDSIVKGLEAVAAHFGKSVRQVRRWAKDGMPRLSGRRFDVIQVQAWLDQRQGRSPQYAKETDPRQPGLTVESGKDHWDEQSKKFQAKVRELEYRKLLGELVELKKVEELFVARIMAVKAGLLSLPRALPPRLVICQSEREMEPVIAKAVRELLETFARPLPEELTAGGGASGTTG